MSGDSASFGDSSIGPRRQPGISTLESGAPLKGTIVICQTVIPEYRVDFFVALLARLSQTGFKLELVAGSTYYSSEITTSPRSVDCGVRLVPNQFLIGRRLLWQRRTVRSITKSSIAILELNPRSLSSWVIVAARRISGRETIVWGHAHSRSGMASRRNGARAVMLRLAGRFIAYGKADGENVRRLLRWPENRVVHAINAISRRDSLKPVRGSRGDIVFSGRLTEEKRPLDLLLAFASVLECLPEGTKLHFIGDGPLRGTIEAATAERGLSSRIIIHGPVYETDHLRKIYGASLVAVSPGTVGLNALQTLGWGVPLIYPMSGRHGPEVALLSARNGADFPLGDVKALAEALKQVFAESETWVERSTEIVSSVSNVSFEGMVDAFEEIIESCRPGPSRS